MCVYKIVNRKLYTFPNVFIMYKKNVKKKKI